MWIPTILIICVSLTEALLTPSSTERGNLIACFSFCITMLISTGKMNRYEMILAY